jgi:Glycosyltransferase family 87
LKAARFSMVTRARRDGRILLMLGSTLFLLASLAMAMSPSSTVVDFKAIYFAARCVILQVNPYDENEFLKVYQAEGGDRAADSPEQRRVVTTDINLPTGLLVFAPFALLPWSVAHVLWIALIAIGMTTAVWMIWMEAADAAPILAAVLLSIFLLTSIVLVDVGNTAGLTVALIAIATCLLLRERIVIAGVVCLAVSLVIKPHDAGFIWLYFMLASQTHRKRALLSLLLAVVIGLPGMIWMSRVAPHWPSDLQRNLAATSAPGDINDPGPQSASAHSADFIVDLRTVISLFSDKPVIYSTLSILIILPVLLYLFRQVLRRGQARTHSWIALASICALSLLPVYHRQDDARLLLLAVPASALLWSEKTRLGRVAVALTGAAILLNGDTPTVLRQQLAKPLLENASGALWILGSLILERPVPIALFALGVFYLAVYTGRLKQVSQRNAET